MFDIAEWTADGQSVTVGVLNIDTTEPSLLKKDQAVLVQDIAYLMALCETVDAGGSR